MTTLEKKMEADNSMLYKVSAASALMMILVFSTMKILGLLYVVELRALNFLIMFFGVRYILLRLRTENEGTLEYLPALFTGFFTAFLTSTLFAVFIGAYLMVDSNLMQHLISSQPLGYSLTPASSALVIEFEGSASGAIVAFALVNLFNRDNVQG